MHAFVSAVDGGVRAGETGPDCAGVGEETHAATLQVVGQTQHEAPPAEGSLLLH